MTTANQAVASHGICPCCEEVIRRAPGVTFSWRNGNVQRLAPHDCEHGRPCSASGAEPCPQCPAGVRRRAQAIAKAREAGAFPEGVPGVVLRLELLRALAAEEEQDPDLARVFEHALVLLVLRTPALVFALAVDKSRQALRWSLSPTCERSRVQAYADQARAHEVIASLVAPLLVQAKLDRL